jgi:pyruvate,water dikinase
MTENVVWLNDVSISDIEKVGGKNASLGEMIGGLSSKGVQVPNGFATTAKAFNSFLDHSNLKNKINKSLKSLDVSNIKQLKETGKIIRKWVEDAPFPNSLLDEIVASYEALTNKLGLEATFAVRSSATAEDLPEASFAGQQETFLNVSGIDNILLSKKKFLLRFITTEQYPIEFIKASNMKRFHCLPEYSKW